jgi:GT2 family glycosyltransferase
MDLSIIIVSWNVRDLLEKCLSSIFNNVHNINYACPAGAKRICGEVFVVDNASADHTAEMVLQKFPQVNLIRSAKNLGFAGGNNLAIREAKGKYILLLNPDTEILDGAAEKMIEFMETRPDAGISGCQILNPDKTLQPSVRRFPNIIDQLLIFLKFTHFLPNIGPLKRYFAADFDYTRPSEVDQIMGAFFMVRREVFDKIGLLDEKFYLWFEEVDFCRRAKNSGYKIMYNPGAQIIHYGGESFKQRMTLTKQWIFFKSAMHYFLKK